MSLNWKIILPIIVLVIGVGAVIKYKNSYPRPAAENLQTQQQESEEKYSYDQNSPPLTDAEINAFVKAASIESAVETEEEKDSVLVTSDNQALNNFNNL
ncbi:MAG TPA: hypothetical protein VLK22_03940 [Candidatus Udaeobacter sp.]|nr:hypothetical protein [Candidatus Udaeobacter sp.]